MPRSLRATLLLPLILAACGDDERTPPCPRVSLLAGTQEQVQFAGGGARIPDDLAWRAMIADFSRGCSYEDGRVEVTIGLDILAERGPALGGSAATTEFFVATVGPDGALLSSERTPLSFAWRDGEQVLRRETEVTLAIPLAQPELGPGYEVLAGFQLTQAQFQYNRARAGSTSRSGADILRGALR